MKVIPNYLAVNHTKGRGGRKPDVIVIHVMEGSMSGTLSWFRNPRAKVSAHYGVSLLGNVVQYVKDEDAAWANGKMVRPTAAIVLERSAENPNDYTLSIEFEGTGTEPLTPLQKEAGVDLIRALAAEHGIPLDRRHVIGHREIRADKACPGRIDVDELVELAADTEAVMAGTLTAEVIPPNLERIIVPTPEHIDEAIRVSSVFTKENVRDGLALFEVILRGVQKGNVKHIAPKILADAISMWLDR